MSVFDSEITLLDDDCEAIMGGDVTFVQPGVEGYDADTRTITNTGATHHAVTAVVDEVRMERRPVGGGSGASSSTRTFEVREIQVRMSRLEALGSLVPEAGWKVRVAAADGGTWEGSIESTVREASGTWLVVTAARRWFAGGPGSTQGGD